MQEKEYCENCKKEITDEMLNNQQVIWASAEHSLYAPSKEQLIPFGDTDDMFSGTFCCPECYNEVSGINIAKLKGISQGKSLAVQEIIKIIDEEIKSAELQMELSSDSILYGNTFARLQIIKSKLAKFQGDKT